MINENIWIVEADKEKHFRKFTLPYYEPWSWLGEDVMILKTADWLLISPL